MHISNVLLALSLPLLLSAADAQSSPDQSSKHAAANPTSHDHAGHAARLIFADGDGHRLKVFDPRTGQIIASFDTVGRMSGLETGPGGRYAYAIHRDDSRITVLDSGLLLVPHGDHNDLQIRRPYIVGTLNVGQGPTHFTHTTAQVGFFNDGDGSVALLPEDLIGISNDMQVVEVAQPEHGAPVIIGDYLLSGGLTTARVDVYRIQDGQKVASYGGCPALHGAARLNKTAYFGCADGVLVLEWHGDHAHARKITNPPRTPEGTRVGMIETHPNSSLIYGNFGKGLSYWQPGSKDMRVLSLSGHARSLAYSEDGKALFVLTDDGRLHRLDAVRARVQTSAAIIPAFQSSEKNIARPDFVVLGDSLWVSSPAAGELTEVDASTLQVLRRVKVGGQPSHLTVSEFDGVQH